MKTLLISLTIISIFPIKEQLVAQKDSWLTLLWTKMCYTTKMNETHTQICTQQILLAERRRNKTNNNQKVSDECKATDMSQSIYMYLGVMDSLSWKALYTTDIFRTKTDIPRIFLEHERFFFFFAGKRHGL